MTTLRLALCVLLLSSASFAGDPPALDAGWTEGWALANGIRIHYYRVPAPGKIVHIDGAGHNVRREQKSRLLTALNAFLDSL